MHKNTKWQNAVGQTLKMLGCALLMMMAGTSNAFHDTIEFEVIGPDPATINEGESITFTIRPEAAADLTPLLEVAGGPASVKFDVSYHTNNTATARDDITWPTALGFESFDFVVSEPDYTGELTFTAVADGVHEGPYSTEVFGFQMEHALAFPIVNGHNGEAIAHISQSTVIVIRDIDPAPLPVLVSNIENPNGDAVGLNTEWGIAQLFNTGPEEQGYTLTAVEIKYREDDVNGFSTQLCAVTETGKPTEPCTLLTRPGTYPVVPAGESVKLRFTAPAGGIYLVPNTSYAVRITLDGPSVTLGETDVGTEDPALPGWTIADRFLFRQGGVWTTAYTTSALQMSVHGSANSALGCTDLWCATLTTKALEGGNHFGCANSQSGKACSNSAHLTDDAFTHAGTAYNITSLQVRANGQVQLWINPDITTAGDSLVLHIGSQSFAFETADTKQNDNRRWNNSGLSWSAGEEVALKLTETPADGENGELRLADGPSENQGRLEVFHAGEWGTVCDDQFDERVDDPRTSERRRVPNLAPIKACQFMGYETGQVRPRGNLSMAPSAQQIWLDDVRCLDNRPHWTGSSPTKLHHCYHAGWGLNNCTHEEDVHLSCTGVLQQQTETPPLTATLENVPTNHDGVSAFTFQIAFSADVDITPEDMRDHALTVTDATVTNATRVDARSDLWELTLEPTGTGAISILVPLNRACTETGALCTAEGQMLSTAPGHSIPGPEPQSQQALTPVMANFVAVPEEHDGETEFWLELTFETAVEQGSKKRIQALLGVSGGSMTKLRRKDGRLDHWRIRIEPSSHEAVTISLSPSPPCGATGAVCTDDGRTFTNAIATLIQGPPGLAVADAEVQEAPNAILAFAVTLNRPPSGTVTVDYATSDGSATAGSDYTRTNGRLTFAAGETEKTVSVPVLDDAHDEGSETLTLTLSNPSGAYLADGSGVGTITNSDPMPKAWMVRFGRTVGSQVVDAITGRFEGNDTPHVTVGGMNLGMPDPAQARESNLPKLAAEMARRYDAGTMNAHEILPGSSFHLSEGEPSTSRPGFAAWGQIAFGGFEADVDDVTMDGNVTSGIIGFDAEWERVLAGVMLSQSSGKGEYRLSTEDGGKGGTVESSLTGFYPYARITLSPRMSAWALAGKATGDLTLKQEGDEPMPTDISMRMGAVGLKGQVLDGTDASGIRLNVKSDAMWVETKSERTSELVATQGDVTRLRLVIEGERTFAAGKGARFTPSAEIGLRHDSGDAETGTGLEVGTGVSYVAGPLTIEGRVRTLVAHEESRYEEWGASAAIRIIPSASGRGLTLNIRPQWGRTGSATERLWSARDANALGTHSEFEASSQIAIDAGYGFGLVHGHGVLTPYAGLTLGDGGTRTMRTGMQWQVSPDAVFGLEGRQHGNSMRGTDNEVRIRAALRF